MSKTLPGGLPKDQMESRWASILEPLLSRPQNHSTILKNVALSAGVNVINHKLGRRLEGWKTSRVRAAATLYDQQDDNMTPHLTLVLVASADVVADIEVF